jgi:hypothetical protein
LYSSTKSATSRWAHGHYILVEHHERQAPVAVERMLLVKVADRLPLPGLGPMVARDLAVVAVHRAVARRPPAELLWMNRQFHEHPPLRLLRAARKAPHEIHDRVPKIRRHPSRS